MLNSRSPTKPARLFITSNTYRWKTVHYWNSLPHYIRSETRMNSFKKILKKWLIEDVLDPDPDDPVPDPDAPDVPDVAVPVPDAAVPHLAGPDVAAPVPHLAGPHPVAPAPDLTALYLAVPAPVPAELDVPGAPAVATLRTMD